MSVRKIRSAWWIDFRHNGVRHRKRSPHNTKAAAREYENALRLRLAAGEDLSAPAATPSTQTAPTLSEFASEWFEHYVRANNKRSEQNTKLYLLRKHLLPWFGGSRLDAVNAAEIEAYKSAKRAEGLAAKSVNNHLVILSKLLQSAQEWARIASVPRTRMMKTAPPRFTFLSDAELALLLGDEREPQWNAMVLVAARTGMRLNELRGLTWPDVDFERNQIAVRGGVVCNYIETTKTYRFRDIPMTSDVRTLLAGMRERNGFVFRRDDGRFVGGQTAGKALGRICKRVGIRHIGWHALRHTFASALATRGVPLHEVKELLGHTSIMTTMRYAHLAPGRLHESIRVLESSASRVNLKLLGNPWATATALALKRAISEARRTRK
jgi:integrase